MEVQRLGVFIRYTVLSKYRRDPMEISWTNTMKWLIKDLLHHEARHE